MEITGEISLIWELFFQYLYPKSHYEIGVNPKWYLERSYLPFRAQKFRILYAGISHFKFSLEN
jgi:hypothetical protein